MTHPLHRPLGTAPGEAFGPDVWPRILIDPTASSLDHDPHGRRFWLAVAQAVLVSVAATVVLLVAVWVVVS